MAPGAILPPFDDLSNWKQGDQRAPHKPLLVLYALGRWQAGQKDVSFREVEPDLSPCCASSGRRGSRTTPSSRSGGFSVTASGPSTLHPVSP